MPEANFRFLRVFLIFFLKERTPTLKKTDWLKIAGKRPFLAITAPGGEPLKGSHANLLSCAVCSYPGVCCPLRLGQLKETAFAGV
jgi:hypothetical protein